MKNIKTTIFLLLTVLLISVLLMLTVYLKDSQSLWPIVAIAAALFSIGLMVDRLKKQTGMEVVEIDDKRRSAKRILNQVLTVILFGSLFIFPRYFGMEYFNLLMASWLVITLCKVFLLSPKSLVINFGKSIRVPLIWRIKWESLLGFKIDNLNGTIFFQQSFGGEIVKISKTADLERLVKSLHRMGVKEM